MNEADVDSDLATVVRIELLVVAFLSVILATFALADAALVLLLNRKIHDAFTATTDHWRRGRLQSEHEKLRKIVICVAIITFVFGGLCGLAALYAMTLQSFWAVHVFFVLLFFSSFRV